MLKPVSRAGDQTIAYDEWVLASRTAVSLMRKYHPEERALALEAHHQLVQELNTEFGWHIARAYDIRQREVAAADVPPMSHPLPLANVTRPDEVRPSLTQEQALANAPEAAEGLFGVPRILDED